MQVVWRLFGAKDGDHMFPWCSFVPRLASLCLLCRLIFFLASPDEGTAAQARQALSGHLPGHEVFVGFKTPDILGWIPSLESSADCSSLLFGPDD